LINSTKLKIGALVIGFGLMSIGLLVQRDQIRRLKAASGWTENAAETSAGESATAAHELIAHESDRAELLRLREEIARLKSSAFDSTPQTTTHDSVTGGFEPGQRPHTQNPVNRSKNWVQCESGFFIVPDHLLSSINLGELLVGGQTIFSAPQVRDAIARIQDTPGVTKMNSPNMATVSGVGVNISAEQVSETDGARVVSGPSIQLVPEASGEGVFRTVYSVRWKTNEPVSTPDTNGPVPVPEVSTMPSPYQALIRDGDTLVIRAWAPVGSGELDTGTCSFLAFITVVEVDTVGVRVRGP
jgi:hypothetical protein